MPFAWEYPDSVGHFSDAPSGDAFGQLFNWSFDTMPSGSNPAPTTYDAPSASPYPSTIPTSPPAPVVPTPTQTQVNDAVRRWCANGGAKGRPCVTPPWDEMRYFEPIKATAIAMESNITMHIAETNPRRVVIIFTVSRGEFVQVSPVDLYDGTMDYGFTLNSEGIPIIITQKDHGILCQCDWFAWTTSAVQNMTMYEVCLRDWPRG